LFAVLQQFPLNIYCIRINWTQSLHIAWFKLTVLKYWNFTSCQCVFTFEDLYLLNTLCSDWVVVELDSGFSSWQVKNTTASNWWLRKFLIEIISWTTLFFNQLHWISHVCCRHLVKTLLRKIPTSNSSLQI
jgi:hypothetical protein